MASIIVHGSLALLGLIFPDLFYTLPLFVASMLPDIEYLPIALKGLIKKRNLKLAAEMTAHTGMLHSILGSVFITLPVSIIISIIYFNWAGISFEWPILIWTILFGIVVHLALDLPAHPTLMLFWPVKVILKNPFLIKWDISIIKKMYPWKYFETRPYQYIGEFNWSVISLVVPLVLLVLLVLI